jgi:hypothetical protein
MNVGNKVKRLSFQSSLLCEGKAEAYPRVESLKGTSLG